MSTPPADDGARGLPFLRLGFRPFYLGAAVLACVAVPLWVLVFLGKLPLRLPMPALWWHAHEMLFGFAVAVVIGFLLTAGKAWTGLRTPRGTSLGLLVLLWLGARISALIGPPLLHAVLDAALLPLVAGVFIQVLVRGRSVRNLPLAAMLVLLSLANLTFHLCVAGVIGVSPLLALHGGLALLVLIECVITGRVVPAFTMGASPGLKLKPTRGLEPATLTVTALALALWVFATAGPLVASIFAAAAVLHVARQWQWQPQATAGRPILWVLHAACAWFPVGFALLAMAQLGWVGASAGVHALAVGATGGLIIAMITRTARGHTGRKLQASLGEVTAYLLVMAAALMRVVLPLVAPQLLGLWLAGSATAWSGAFAIYLVVFTPWLMSERVDGKDG